MLLGQRVILHLLVQDKSSLGKAKVWLQRHPGLWTPQESPVGGLWAARGLTRPPPLAPVPPQLWVDGAFLIPTALSRDGRVLLVPPCPGSPSGNVDAALPIVSLSSGDTRAAQSITSPEGGIPEHAPPHCCCGDAGSDQGASPPPGSARPASSGGEGGCM